MSLHDAAAEALAAGCNIRGAILELHAALAASRCSNGYEQKIVSDLMDERFETAIIPAQMSNLHKAATEFAEAFQTSAGDIDDKLEALLDVLEEKEMQHYQCNYCGFEGEHMHSCTTYIETLKVFAEYQANPDSIAL